MNGWWIDDEAKAVLRVAGHNAFDLAARYVFGIGFDVDAGPGRIGRVDREDDRTGGAADGFEEFLCDRPVDQYLLSQGRGARTTAR